MLLQGQCFLGGEASRPPRGWCLHRGVIGRPQPGGPLISSFSLLSLLTLHPSAACLPPCPPAARTHRELFSLWYADLLKEPLEALLAAAPRPPAAEAFFAQMMRDLEGAGADPMQQVGKSEVG